MDVQDGGSSGNQLPAAGNSVQAAAAPTFRYNAFISYSHAADGALAPALRNGLQRFATAWRALHWINPVRSVRVFQDQASLSANPALWPTIEDALVTASWFILLASPEAAASPWVDKEVEFWCRNRMAERLLIVQTDGEITWDTVANDFDWARTTALPKQLAKAYPHEPRWIDARWARTGAQATLRDPRFRDLVAELAAPLRGIAKDELIGEDIRQHRLLNRWRNAVVGVLTTLLIGAIVAAFIAFQQRNEALQNQSRYLLGLAEEAQMQGSTVRAARFSLRAINTSLQDWKVSVRARNVLRSVLSSAATSQVLGRHEGNAWSVAPMADGRHVVSGGDDHRILLWDRGKPSIPEELGRHDGRVLDVAIAPDGRHVASGGGEGRVSYRNTTEPEDPVDIGRHDGEVYAVLFSETGGSVITGGHDGRLLVWDPSTPGKPREFGHHNGDVWVVTLAPDGRRVVSGGGDNRVVLWDPENSTGASVEIGHQDGQITALTVTPDKRGIVSGNDIGQLFFYSLDAPATPIIPIYLGRHRGEVYSLASAPDGAHVVSAGEDGELLMWEPNNPGEPKLLGKKKGKFVAVARMPDSQQVVTGSDDGWVLLWDISPSDKVATGKVRIGNHNERISALAVSADGRLVVTGDAEGKVMLWDITRPDSVIELSAHELSAHKRKIMMVGSAPDGYRVISGSEDGEILCWVRDERGSPTRVGRHEGVQLMAASRTGESVVSVGSDGHLLVWDVAKPGPPRDLGFYKHRILSISLTDGKQLVLGDESGRVTVIDVTPPLAHSQEVGRNESPVLAVDSAPGGRRVVSGGVDGRILLWNPEKPNDFLELGRHDGKVLALAFAADGRHVASGDEDGRVFLWDVERPGIPLEIGEHIGGFQAVAVVADGKKIVTGGLDGQIWAWDAELDVLKLARSIQAFKELSEEEQRLAGLK